ncbi:MAG: hypothetical protein AAF974_04785 [Cyanobacteria bacterium P01_E01_bin.34]
MGDTSLTLKWGVPFSVKKALCPTTVSLEANTEAKDNDISITGFEDRWEGALLDFPQLVPSGI